MAAPVHNKYYLRTLHEEIDLFDRKLAHMLKYDTFATEAARKTSTNKMEAKRELLVKLARQLASEGIEFKASELPRSLRPEDNEQAPTETASTELPPTGSPAAEGIASMAAPVTRSIPSPFAGTVLDAHGQVEAYKRARTSKTVA